MAQWHVVPFPSCSFSDIWCSYWKLRLESAQSLSVLTPKSTREALSLWGAGRSAVVRLFMPWPVEFAVENAVEFWEDFLVLLPQQMQHESAQLVLPHVRNIKGIAKGGV